MSNAEAAGTDFLFLPDAKQIYADGYTYKMSEGDISKLFAAHRPDISTAC